MRSSLVLAAALAAVAVIVAPEAAARVRSISTPTRDVSQTPKLAEGEATVAYNPTDRRNLIVGSNQWQPLTDSDSEDYVGLGPDGFTRCAVWSSKGRRRELAWRADDERRPGRRPQSPSGEGPGRVCG
jgi:hypothetical protein